MGTCGPRFFNIRPLGDPNIAPDLTDERQAWNVANAHLYFGTQISEAATFHK
jgi:hypothetical protein